MKISELVKELNAQKKKIGDCEVMVAMRDIEEKATPDYSHENQIILVPEKIPLMNADTERLSKRKYQVLSISIDG